MKISPFKTLLIGFGRIGAAYADDPAMAECIPYASHAQVLASHRAFAWNAVVDSSEDACRLAEKRWNIPETSTTILNLCCREEIEVAVIATPPEVRVEMLEALPNLRAVLVEKPLGLSVKDAENFLHVCQSRNILVQVNLTRRTDKMMQGLADGGLYEKIGSVQAAFGIYGNGLINNGTHMIDLVRMLLGEVKAVQAIPYFQAFTEGPIRGDTNLAFILFMESGLSVVMEPIRFSHYRECSLDLWGERGRLEILQEGLTVIEYPRVSCRSLQGAMEVASERASIQTTDYGYALYRMYDNLSEALIKGEVLKSPGDSALKTEMVVEAVFESAHKKSEVISIGGRSDNAN
ncbi:MAG: Gfo/Idh/MocA family oxidoreductase [bacterium]